MPIDLAGENKQLRRRLSAFVSQVKQNEEKLQRFQQQELDLISANGLAALLQEIFHSYKNNFRLDAISLVLLDADYEISHIVDNLNLRIQYPDLILIPSADYLHDIVPDTFIPRLIQGQKPLFDKIFPHGYAAITSTGVFPIVRNQQLIGCLNLGSTDKSRFSPGSATDFIERLTGILAICIENALNHERIRQLGLIDPLTGIHNRRYFDQRLAEEVLVCERQKTPLSCLYIDIDYFKRINDRYGHQAGDIVLQELGKLLKLQMRKSDVLARLGGEEFSILLFNTDREEALEIAERIRHSVADHPVQAGDQEFISITLSLGCATINGTEQNADLAAHLLQLADQALYTAKSSGRNRVC